jgi:hypothetical protein
MKLFLASVLLLFSLASTSQTAKVKLYGYVQPVTGGVPPISQPDEKENHWEQKKSPRANYFIYLSFPKNQTIYPVELWIKGQAYNINVEPALIPVEIIYDNGDFKPEKITLVPAIKDSCVQLWISGTSEKSTTVKNSLTENNDLVVVYKLKGEFYTKVLKKIRQLQTATLP